MKTLRFTSRLLCHIILHLTLLAFMSSSSAVKHSSSFFFNSFFRCCTSRKASSLSRLIRWASSAFCLAVASNEASCDWCCIWKQQTHAICRKAMRNTMAWRWVVFAPFCAISRLFSICLQRNTCLARHPTFPSDKNYSRIKKRNS